MHSAYHTFPALIAAVIIIGMSPLSNVQPSLVCRKRHGAGATKYSCRTELAWQHLIRQFLTSGGVVYIALTAPDEYRSGNSANTHRVEHSHH